MKQVSAKMADVIVGLGIEADEVDVPSDQLSVKVDPQHRRYVHAGRVALHLVPADLHDLIDMPFRIRHPLRQGDIQSRISEANPCSRSCISAENPPLRC